MSQRLFEVSTLVHYLKMSIQENVQLQSIMVKGEISNFTNHRSGHWYFTLKDTKAKVSCVMFATYASRNPILIKEGMQVIVSGNMSMYEASGSIQLYALKVQADGLGDLYLQLAQIKEKLQKEGLFDTSHKKLLSEYPMRIAIVSAKSGAAIHDVLITLRSRWPIADVEVFPSLVQGENAAQDIINNLLKIDSLGFDAIILARGGGSLEDLWCFNQEDLVRCIYHLKTFIVSGIGHESDTTISDYVSDLRAPTPTAAAQLITPDIKEIKQQITNRFQLLYQNMKSILEHANKDVNRLMKHHYIKDPTVYIKDLQFKLAMQIKALSIIENQIQNNRALIIRQKQYVKLITLKKLATYSQDKKTITQNLKKSMQYFKASKQKSLQEVIQLMDAYSPLKILKRGYHIAYQKELLLKSIHDVKYDSEIQMIFHDGTLVVEPKKEEDLKWQKKQHLKKQCKEAKK